MDKSTWKKFEYHYDDCHSAFFGVILAVSEAHARHHFKVCDLCHGPAQLKISEWDGKMPVTDEASEFLSEAADNAMLK